jgi:DNA-directed RNA polymerase subunit RPC12/RpoP
MKVEAIFEEIKCPICGASDGRPIAMKRVDSFLQEAYIWCKNCKSVLLVKH